MALQNNKGVQLSKGNLLNFSNQMIRVPSDGWWVGMGR